jgi:hypothetical protein
MIQASREYQTQTAGMEPGLDPDERSIDDERLKSIHSVCQITIMEYSEDNIQQYELYNEDLKAFLEHPREDWVKVRWINCNGTYLTRAKLAK